MYDFQIKCHSVTYICHIRANSNQIIYKSSNWSSSIFHIFKSPRCIWIRADCSQITFTWSKCWYFFHIIQCAFNLSNVINLSNYFFSFYPASIVQNIYCFVPFYMMYVLFVTLHVKFAYPTYRIGLRYRILNNTLNNTFPNRKSMEFYFVVGEVINDFHFVFFFRRRIHSLEIQWTDKSFNHRIIFKTS